MSYEKPLPKPNPDTEPFWKGCKEHQLRFQKCENCGHVRWPPSIICPSCYSREVNWIVANGRGKIFSFAVCHHAYHPAFKNDLPYVVAIVELEEGPHLLTNIIGCNHEALRCEMPVQVIWEDIAEGVTLPKFGPAS